MVTVRPRACRGTRVARRGSAARRAGPGRILGTCRQEPTMTDRADLRSRARRWPEPPDPWESRSDAELARRAAVPHDRHDRGRAGPGEADRRATRGRRSGRRPRGGDPGRARGRRAGRRDRLRDVGARAPWPRSRSCARRPRAAGLDGSRLTSEQAFELALAPPARGLVIGISHEGATARDERGPGGGPGGRRADRRHHRQRPARRPRRWPRSSSRPASSTRAGATRSAT